MVVPRCSLGDNGSALKIFRKSIPGAHSVMHLKVIFCEDSTVIQ